MKKPVTSQKTFTAKQLQQEQRINTAPQDEILAAFIA